MFITSEEMKEYLDGFCRSFGFPEDARKDLSAVLSAIRDIPSVWEKFLSHLSRYEEDPEGDFAPIFEEQTRMSAEAGVHPYALHLLFLVLLSAPLRRFYEERGLSDEIYRASVSDLLWKLRECREVHHVSGNACAAFWTIDIFRLKLFTLGRLTFCLSRSPRDLFRDGVLLVGQGEPVIETHIPSSGPLLRDDVLASYRRAAAFFGDAFGDRPIVFTCHSWLLSARTRRFLAPDSRILAFASDYTILSEEDDPKNADAWRVFGREIGSDPSRLDALPEDTALRRGLAAWLRAGGSMGVAYGVLPYDEVKV